MINFTCDYTRSACPEILSALTASADLQNPGYSDDTICAEARALVRQICQNPDIDVHFLVGGTQTNTTVISAALRPHEGVIAATTGHVNVHETGAIESTGHKVLTIPTDNGKLTAEQVDRFCTDNFNDPNFEHIVRAGMLYISLPTELGTIYSLAEIKALSDVCRRHGILFYIDGARLPYALATPGCDITLPALAALTDAFYIGGTKCGALMGEALVISNPSLKKHFRYIMKQRGALLAKGYLLGIQFRTLFTDSLYLRLAENAIREADRIRQTLRECNIPLYIASPTNQLFPILTGSQLTALQQNFLLDVWQSLSPDTYLVRITTDWSTRPSDVDALLQTLRSLSLQR